VRTDASQPQPDEIDVPANSVAMVRPSRSMSLTQLECQSPASTTGLSIRLRWRNERIRSRAAV